LIDVVNLQAINLNGCRLLVHDARSFDRRKSTFREGFGFEAVVDTCKTLFAGDKTSAAWLVRINGDHLEVGNTVSHGVLRWPRGDDSDEQQWLLRMSFDTENAEPWKFDIHVTWFQKTNALSAVVLRSN
jgi:hypothetical protein